MGDARPSVQAAIDRASAAGGGTVSLQANAALDLGSPVVVPSNVTLKGDRTTLRCYGSYRGPLVCVGLQARPGEFDGSYRVTGPYDASVAGSRKGFDTFNRSCLAVTSHPLQFGKLSAAGVPDYWNTTDPITIDAMVSRAAGQDNRPVAGITDEHGRPAPWCLRFHPAGFALDVLDRDNPGDNYRVLIDAATTPGVYRLAAQFDPETGLAYAWDERGRLPVKWDAAGPWVPGTPLRPHDGFRPFQVGAEGPIAWHAAEAFTDLAVYGLRVCRAAAYDVTKPQLTFIKSPSTPANDRTRFFDANPSFYPAEALLGLLPLDKPNDGNPWLPCDTAYGPTLLPWCPAGRSVTAGNVRIEGVTLAGSIQPALLLGQDYDLTLANVTASGTQGVGTLPHGPGYPLVLERCKLSGIDASLVLWQHIGDARGLQLPQVGRDGVRAFGGDFVFDRPYAWRASPHTRTLFRMVGHSDGGTFAFRDGQFDNEDASGGLADAVFSFKSGTWKTNNLAVDGFAVANVPAGSAYIHLDGEGLDDGNRETSWVDARRLKAFNGCDVALKVTGPDTWHGYVDAAALTPGKLADVPDDTVGSITVDVPAPRSPE